MKKLLKFYKNNYMYLLLLIPLIICSTQLAHLDNDTWFILSHGRVVMNEGFVHFDPLSMHQNLHFVMQQWLFSILLWTFFHFLGPSGLFMLLFLFSILLMVITYKCCYLISNNRNKSIFLTCLMFYLMKGFLISRPQVITYMLVIALIYLLEKYIKTEEKSNLLLIVIISLIQINIHASMWPFLFIYMLPFFADLLLKKDKYKIKELLILVFIMILSGFFNPYGYEAMLYLFNSIGNINVRSAVGEMRYTSFLNYSGKLFIFLIIISLLFLVYLKKSKSEVKVRYFCLFIGCLLLGALQLKSVSYFIISFILLVASLDLKEFKFKKMNILKDLGSRIIMFSNIFIVISLFIAIYYTIIRSPINYKSIYHNSAQYILKNEDVSKVRMYTCYDAGSNFEYYGIKTYMDTRAEVFYKKNNKKEEIFDEYYKIIKTDSEKEIKKFIEKYKFTHMYISEEKNLEKYIKNHGYSLVYRDKVDENNEIGRIYKRD